MSRRKVIFWNDLNDSYIVSEEYNGDKAEMERFGLGACDHTWPEFMEAMSSVSNMADFLKVISYITASYHATCLLYTSDAADEEWRASPGAGQ